MTESELQRQEFIVTLIIAGGIVMLGILVIAVLGFWAYQLFNRKTKKEITHELLSEKRENGATITKQNF